MSHPAALPTIRSITASSATIVRMRSDVALPPGPALPNEDAASIIVQLRPFESLALWRGGRSFFNGGYDRGGLAITDLCDTWRCHHGSAFDNLRMRVERRVLQDFARELGVRGPVSLSNPAGSVDPVIFNLAQALLPSLDGPEQRQRLFLDQMVGAFLIHILQAYGSAAASGRHRPRLTPRQEALAKEILSAHLPGNISVDEVAAQCNLSRSHFIRAFCNSTGKTPYQWLTERRIEVVKNCLAAGTVPISMIAAECGFVDQSHLTRVFKRVTGVTPADWRKRNDL
ncbi:HTH-type transcriptional activator RhaR [Cupriavidus laharis]|uniref:HTH-type transcriptional activator RhaR n=1 Tax=Cupriavidus laharis TaxID=151654 RepID=A0ABN7ZML4_9BURK|nr:AraC family transcriptional regulator [Cupriavidus laharis]CAG9185536.1 HTH-type transcriptional activator RhaR [Cupriavidus laharis]